MLKPQDIPNNNLSQIIKFFGEERMCLAEFSFFWQAFNYTRSSDETVGGNSSRARSNSHPLAYMKNKVEHFVINQWLAPGRLPGQ